MVGDRHTWPASSYEPIMVYSDPSYSFLPTFLSMPTLSANELNLDRQVEERKKKKKKEDKLMSQGTLCSGHRGYIMLSC